MRSTGAVIAGLVAATMAAPAKAEDWRAVSTSHHDVVFVDSDSVRRQPDGRIAFRARHRLAENESNRDFGYDRIDVPVEGRCAGPEDEPGPAVSRRSYRLKGRPIPARDWREEDIAEDAAHFVADICNGMIGHRRFADLDSAMAEYDEHGSLARLAAHVTGEVDLVGTVVQGWEMNGVSLCGSEAGCKDDSPTEFCWLDGNINVPAPAGAPEWVDGGPRRDSAGAAFRGRIHRSLDGEGFGHMGGYACLVEATGPARFVEVPKRLEARPDDRASVTHPEILAAHQALVQTVKSAGKVGVAVGRRRWEADDLSLGAGNGACYSLPVSKGVTVTSIEPVLSWRQIERMNREGSALTLVARHYDSGLAFHFPDPKTAPGLDAFVRKLSGRGVAAVSQKGSKVAVRYSDGRNESFRFADSASAVQAAGIAGRLQGREIAKVEGRGSLAIATPLRRMSLTFPDEAFAQQAEERIQAMRSACGLAG